MFLYSDHYTASQEGELEPFDVTYLRNDLPQKAYLNDEFFPGFKIALASMKEKEVADFLIGPEYAFGKLGCPPRILPDATRMCLRIIIVIMTNNSGNG